MPFDHGDWHLHFMFNNINYFTEMQLIQVKDGLQIFKVAKDIYQYEIRKKERLLAFPHRKIYIYMEIENSAIEKNVFFLNKLRQGNTKIFKNFIKIASDKKFYNDNDEPLMGFRVLDVSSVGASFITNIKEAKLFSINTKISVVKLDWQGECYPLKNVIVNNIVDYIDPRALGVSMYKIGILFDSNQLLDQKLAILLSNDSVNLESREEYLKYINRNNLEK
ncbi:MAG: hypothetical protein A2202_01545 [Bdellovibrionales bacterium RIFOXYA1_FULL_36_14]|nr:MAG: hypothetical protein A2202_01545 [Bdellovibrionales bacterium RIFOXYA1_FULL_36_14]